MKRLNTTLVHGNIKKTCAEGRKDANVSSPSTCQYPGTSQTLAATLKVLLLQIGHDVLRYLVCDSHSISLQLGFIIVFLAENDQLSDAETMFSYASPSEHINCTDINAHNTPPPGMENRELPLTTRNVCVRLQIAVQVSGWWRQL